METVDQIPEKPLLSFKVRGADTESVFRFLEENGPTPFERISQCFANTDRRDQPRDEELLREVLDFLRVIELVERYTKDNQGRWYRVREGVSKGEPYQLLLLRQLHSLTGERNAFRLCHHYTLRENRLFVSKEDLLKLLEKHSSDGYTWNLEKLRTWENLATFTGLVRSVKPAMGDLMISPTSDLLRKTMVAYCASQTNAGEAVHMEFLAGDWLNFVEENYFNTRTIRDQIAIGISESLLAMEKRKLLEFGVGSDAPSSLMLGQRRVNWLKLI